MTTSLTFATRRESSAFDSTQLSDTQRYVIFLAYLIFVRNSP